MKKILIAVLAAVTLFSFASCDNSNSNTGTGSQLDIAYIEGAVKNAKDYLVGDTPDPADFTFTGYDASGNVVMEDMSSTLFTADELTSSTAEATFAYNGLVPVSTISVPVNVYDIDKFEVNADGADVVKTYYTVVATGDDSGTTDASYDAYRVIDKTGLVVTVTYDGTKTRTLAADEYDAVLGTVSGAFTEDTTWGTAGAKVVQVSFGDESATYPVTLANNLVSSIAVDVTEDYIVYYDGQAAGASDKLSSDDVKLIATMANGQTGKVLSSDVTYSSSSTGKFGALNAIDLSNLSSVTVYAKYSGTDVVESFNNNTVVSSRAISIVKDYAVGIEAAASSLQLELGTDYAKDADPEQTTLTGLTVKYVMASDGDEAASGDELTLNADEDGYTIAGANGRTKFTTDDGYVAGRTVTITVTSGSWTDTVTATLKAAE